MVIVCETRFSQNLFPEQCKETGARTCVRARWLLTFLSRVMHGRMRQLGHFERWWARPSAAAASQPSGLCFLHPVFVLAHTRQRRAGSAQTQQGCGCHQMHQMYQKTTYETFLISLHFTQTRCAYSSQAKSKRIKDTKGTSQHCFFSFYEQTRQNQRKPPLSASCAESIVSWIVCGPV